MINTKQKSNVGKISPRSPMMKNKGAESGIDYTIDTFKHVDTSAWNNVPIPVVSTMQLIINELSRVSRES